MPLPTTTFEQRSHLYTDVEDLIQIGFLSHPIMVGETQLCLRSLLPGDLYTLKYRAAKEESWRLWTVASSIWLLDGVSLLTEPHSTPFLAKSLKRIPHRILEILFSLSLGLFNRTARAMKTIESFCYEDNSRYLWRSLGRNVPSGHVGIPGVERLGMNPIQGMWVLFNQAEDDRISMENSWEGAKLIASAMSPKGIQKLDQRDKQRKADENARRQRVMDNAYYVSMGVVTEEGEVSGSQQTIHGAHSTEELEEEMRKWVAGEEDWHDRIVSEYKARIAEGIENQKLEHQARMEALRRESERRENEDPGPVTMVAYTPEQLNDILKERNQGPPGIRRIYPEQDQRQHLYDKYIARKVLEPQQMVATSEGGLSPLEAELVGRQVPFRAGKGG